MKLTKREVLWTELQLSGLKIPVFITDLDDMEAAGLCNWVDELLVAQVHDACTMLVHESKADKWLKRLPEIMHKELKHVSLVSDAKAGRSWDSVK